MTPTILDRMALTLAGAVALGVGLGILFFPHRFHASAGLVLGDDVTLLNEMRSPGGMLLICALFILAGAVRASVTAPALAVSACCMAPVTQKDWDRMLPGDTTLWCSDNLDTQ